MTLAWVMTREKKMTGIDPERRKRRLRWAAEHLEVNPGATPDEVRADWLQRLPMLDFVPPSEDRAALAALLRRQREGGWEASADQQAYAWEEEQLRGEVEAFAQQFWEILPDERRRRWEELANRCAFAPTLRARLSMLEAGLTVDSREQPGENALVIGLGRHIREQFVLRPGPRAVARQLLLSRIQEHGEWTVAARHLRHVYPALASLGSDLLNRLRTETPQLPHLDFAASRRQHAPQPATANTGESQSPWRLMWFLVVVAVTILRLFSTAFKGDSSSPSQPVRVPPGLLQPERNREFPPGPFDRSKDQDKRFEKEQENLKKEVEALLKKYGIKEGKGRDRSDGKSP
jgi:hypothetical protein